MQLAHVKGKLTGAGRPPRNHLDHAMKLFKSYPQDRKQSARITEYKNEQKVLNYGAPQGTVFGRILFEMQLSRNSVVVNMLMDHGG